MVSTQEINDDDHNRRLDVAVLQKVDLNDPKQVEHCIGYLNKNVALLRSRHERLETKSAAFTIVDLSTGPIHPEYWRTYKKYRLLTKKLAEIESTIGNV